MSRHPLPLLVRLLPLLPFAALFIVPPPAAPSRPMTSTDPRCSQAPLQQQLRAWLDPIPSSFSAALPPGVVAPTPQPRGLETHALNVELSLSNPDRRPHQARVLSARWHQGPRGGAIPWIDAPDLSPLNRYSHIERQLLVLADRTPLVIDLRLELDGRSCILQLSIPVPPPSRSPL